MSIDKSDIICGFTALQEWHCPVIGPSEDDILLIRKVKKRENFKKELLKLPFYISSGLLFSIFLHFIIKYW